MIKKQSQIKVNMSTKLRNIIKKKADSVGLPMAAYLRHAGLGWQPELRASAKVERDYRDYIKNKDTQKSISSTEFEKWLKESIISSSGVSDTAKVTKKIGKANKKGS